MNTNNKKTIKKMLGILVAIVVFAFPISTAFASDNTSTSTTEPYYCDEGGSHHRRNVGQIGWCNSVEEAENAITKYFNEHPNLKHYTIAKCSCGKYTAYITEPNPDIPIIHTHSWDNGVVTREATCTEKGIITYTCSGCDEIRTEDIAEINHNYVSLVISPTCTEEGYTIHTCETCKGYYIDSKTDATGHDYQYVANNDGTHNKVCTVCGDTVVENCNKVAEGDHYICNDCSARYEDTTKPTEPNPDIPVIHTHSWDNGVVTKEATCTEKGIITYTCSGCDEIRTEDIAEINHNYVSLVISPTCTEEGYTIHTCETCKGYYIDSKTDATGHDYQYVANNDGTHNKVCTACGDAVVENCNKVAEGDHYICSDCSARYEDTAKPTEPSTELPTEPTTDTVTKPTTSEPSTKLPTEPTTDTVTKPNETVTGEDNIEVSDEAKTENKAVTEGENGITANEDKNTEQKSPSTGAELIDTGDNTSMNILFLGAGLVMTVAVAVILMKVRKEESSSL